MLQVCRSIDRSSLNPTVTINASTTTTANLKGTPRSRPATISTRLSNDG
jgi:hypothetical protein